MRTTFNVDRTQWPEVWQAVYRVLEESLAAQQLCTWIQPLEMVENISSEEGLKIRLSAPNDWVAEWNKKYYKEALEKAFAHVTGARCEVEIGVSDESTGPAVAQYEPPVVQSAPITPPAFSAALSSGPLVLNTSSKLIHDNHLDPRYVFDGFVVGASNQFAHASAVAVAEHPAKQYNPLFLYSPPGLGKTHLLHAIGNHLITRNSNARVAYLSAEKFVNELIDSLQHRKMAQFRLKYRDSYDMILIDDIQFIAGKNTSEEEFFHTFNALHSSKRQIVVTSDRPPKEIEGLEERVRTRFEWGLVADIGTPEIETRIAILKAKAERDDIYLPDEVATFLATYIKSNVRELEGVLIRLQAQASLTGAEISLQMAKQELKLSIPEEGSQYTIESIQGAVAKHFHLKVQDLKAATRVRTVALPRQIAVYLVRKYTGLGYREIGNYFGGKDHTTILHACNKIEKGVEKDPSLLSAVESIQNLL